MISIFNVSMLPVRSKQRIGKAWIVNEGITISLIIVLNDIVTVDFLCRRRVEVIPALERRQITQITGFARRIAGISVEK